MIEIDSLSPLEAAVLPVKLQWRLVHYWRDTGQFASAHALIDEHARQSGPTITGLMERSRLALAEGDAESALKHARERHSVSSSMSATLDLARCELAVGNLEGALALVRRLHAEGSTGPSVQMLDADIRLAGGNLQDAERLFRRALDTEVPSLDAYLGLARLEIARGNAATARDHLALLLTEPDRLDVRKRRQAAELFEQLGMTDQAAQLRSEADSAMVLVKEELGREVQSRLGAVAHLGSDAIDFGAMPSEPVVVEPTPPLDSQVLETLHRVFGFRELRPGQAEVVANVMAGRDALAIMPTGSGKSLTFQLPALLLPGVTIVISPLIALMKDQVESLPAELRARTRLINSSLSREEMRNALDELKAGALKLVYVAPERLRDRAFLQAMRATRISLLVVDEAHCISLWGQDFRPDYLFIPRAVAAMGQPPVLAVTATATPAMADQIASGLGREMARCRVSLFRPNLHYEVRHAGSREFKIREMIDVCKELKGSGIVYVNSRMDTESFAGLLRDNGVSAIAYHAGLEPPVRAQSQDRFMSGQVRVVVATIAFGMGVDKANVRFILHFNPPASLEAYAQESGRAGRDGEPARCILLATRTDETRLRNFSGRDALGKRELRLVYANIKRRAAGRWALLNRNDVEMLSGGNPEIDSKIAIGLLDQAGLISRHPDVPLSIHLSWQPGSLVQGNVDPGWERLLAWLGPKAAHGRATIDVAALCRDPEWSPLKLDEILATQPEIQIREGPRMTCIELLPAGPDSPARVDRLLADVDALAERRIQQVMAYTRRRTCRHVMLAAQFGEKIPPCESSCDVCMSSTQTAESAERPASPAKPAPEGPDAALAILEAVRTLPFPMGRTGLVRLVTGSAESRVRADRSASFGVLSAMKKGAVERLVDRLIELGYLFRDTGHEYLLISLTARGKNASREDLGQHFIARSRARTGDSDIDSELLQQLKAWRSERASRDQVAAFVVAHNSMLEAVASFQPRTLSELEQVPGVGPSKTAKYGSEILVIVNG